jgi:hypothetical protein
MARELRSLGQGLIVVNPGAPELFHLSAQHGNRFENAPARSGRCILEVEEGQALFGKLSIEFEQLFEGGSGFLLEFDVVGVLGCHVFLSSSKSFSLNLM